MAKQGHMTMQLVARDNWRTSDTTRLVAALAALGVPVRTERVWRDKQGDERVTYLHASRTVDPLRAAMPPVKVMVKGYRKGDLQKKDPLHPLLDGLRVIAILQALRSWITTGQEHEIANCTPGRYLLVSGTATRATFDIVRTAHIYRAAGLILLGHPIARIEEPEADLHAFVIGNNSYAGHEETAAQLITQHKEGTLPHIHPFAAACHTARVYDRLIQHVADEVTMLLFKAKFDPRYAFLSSNSTDDAKRRTDQFIAGD